MLLNEVGLFPAISIIPSFVVVQDPFLGLEG